MMDRSMICAQCGNQFILTSHEQEKLLARGFGLPRRCAECRKHKSKNRQEDHGDWDFRRKRKRPFH